MMISNVSEIQYRIATKIRDESTVEILKLKQVLK